MPGKDRTGPVGLGSRTGRGMGDCSPTGQQNNLNPDIQRPANTLGWGGRLWDTTFGRLFGRGRLNRPNRIDRTRR